jgi:arsenite methyltransferase
MPICSLCSGPESVRNRPPSRALIDSTSTSTTIRLRTMIRVGLRDTVLAGIARQLRHPEGIRGRLTARGLNRGNRGVVLAAVAATGLDAGQAAADIGFGGGVGLRSLLDGVGADGHVHGVEVSDTMLAVARRRFVEDVAAGRLSLHAGDLVDLPLESGSLDAAITVNTVYFVQNLERAFAEIARALRPNGRVVVGVGDPVAMAAMPFTAHGFTLRPIDDLTRLLRASGFDEPRDERVGSGERAFHLLVADRAAGG